jgi:hypothetical protein
MFDPPLETWGHIDGFGDACTPVVAPAGRTTVSTQFEIYDAGLPNIVLRDGVQHEIKDLPSAGRRRRSAPAGAATCGAQPWMPIWR